MLSYFNMLRAYEVQIWLYSTIGQRPNLSMSNQDRGCNFNENEETLGADKFVRLHVAIYPLFMKFRFVIGKGTNCSPLTLQ
jgi:hypothetical protein